MCALLNVSNVKCLFLLIVLFSESLYLYGVTKIKEK